MSTEINDVPQTNESCSSKTDEENVAKNIQKDNVDAKVLNGNVKKRKNVDFHEPQTKRSKDSEQLSNFPSDLSTSSSKNAKAEKSTTDYTNLVANHYNALEEKGLSQRNQSRIVYMRNFNNWVKSIFINEYIEKIRSVKSHGSPLVVLDMCCGKGGDLFKWKKANITHLICADIAEVSVEQCQNRYRDLGGKAYAPLFSAEFLSCDCTRVRLREKYKDASMQVDLVSCQFAFHYSFESLPQAECMLKNASESLKPGGYFIGTIPNANELVARWQKAENNKFGNDIYSIEFQCDKENIPLFGAKYNFQLEGVVNCPEFLVHLPTLCKLALKFGLELIRYERFEDYYERMKEDGKTLLSKMQALETYPPYHEAPLLAENTQEYQHAVEYMQNSTGHRKIGTISQSEWEAISLYSVFAFQKLKYVWNAEGKPEYTKN